MMAAMKKTTNYFPSPKSKKQKFDEETKTVESNETSLASAALCDEAWTVNNWPRFWTSEQINDFC
jgi:hypothetical protein